MKRSVGVLLAAICVFSLTACGSKKPSQAEVEQAIANGNMTVEDALDKGWITQEWADHYFEENSVDAADKRSEYGISDFETQTINGEIFTLDDISNASFLAFIDPADAEAEAYYQALVDANDRVKEAGGSMVVFSKSEEHTELFVDAPFPVAFFNDTVKSAVGSNFEMIDAIANTGCWYVNGYFYSSWYGRVNADDLASSAEGFVQAAEGQSDEADQDAVMVG